jgi:hypothetical protein
MGYIIAFLGIILSIFGINQQKTELVEVKNDSYTFIAPSTWKQIETTSKDQIFLYSDLDITNFKKGAISGYKFPNVVVKDAKFDANYCQEHFQQLTKSIFANKYLGIKVYEVTFKDDSCVIEYDLINQNTDGIIQTQKHLQKLFIKEKDEYVIDLVTSDEEIPEYYKAILKSFTAN